MSNHSGTMNYGAWAERQSNRDTHLRDMEATATDLRRLVIEDSGQHRRLDDIHKAQEKFASQVMAMFRNADQERFDMGKELAAINTKVTGLVWLAGTCLSAGIIGMFAMFFGLIGKGHG